MRNIPQNPFARTRAFPAMRAQLSLLDGDAKPNTVELAPERPISIGRSRDNTVVLAEEEQASRLHARLYYEGGRWLLRDFGLNGTRVDNARVNQVTELADGNEIRIGAVRFRFQLSDASRHSGSYSPTMIDRSAASETVAVQLPGPRWTNDELLALNQFMTAAIDARNPIELARALIQSLYYQAGAAFAGYFSLDPTNPVAKFVWPVEAKIDDSLARQLTRRMQRDHRVIWLAEDTAATVANPSGKFHTTHADALALPLKSGSKVMGAIHLYKASGYFSDRDRKYAETVVSFAAPLFRRMRKQRSLEAELTRLKSAVPDGEEILGDSPTMVALRAELARVASSTRPILFHGEPGVGKGLAARDVHRRGPRSEGPFVTVRCTNMPSNLVEAELFGYRKGAFSGADREYLGQVALADDGTLFFDEIADLPADCQVKLIKLMESRSYRALGATHDSPADVRLMFATAKDMSAEVKAGRFRGDLFTAIKACEVTVPALREHPEDIPHLAQFFLDRLAGECRHEWFLTPGAIHVLREKNWPGNVRQLRSVLAHTAASAETDQISEVDLRRQFHDG